MDNNADMFSSSTAPLTWHDFLERMRQPSAAEFVKAIKSFIVSFSNHEPDPERDSASVQQFLADMEAAFRAHSLWAGCTDEELESAGEGLEKYVMTKLYTRVFASLLDDVKVDEQLSEKMALVQQFIRPENLDIQPTYQNETSWLLAQKELQKINMYKAPREKLACILNCCKVITNLLLNASIAANENPPGADEFLPVLIYVTMKANPPQLHSNLLYIQRYRRQTRLVGEAAYYFTNMLSAESFILNIDANSISMDESEFERNMESSRAVLSGLSSDFDENSTSDSFRTAKPVESKQQASMATEDFVKRPQISAQPAGVPSGSEDVRAKKQSLAPNAPSITDFEEKGATMLLKEDSINKVFEEFPYLFANSGDLTVGDVEDLLNNYKQLVLRYVCLAKGLSGAPPYFTPSGSLSHTQTQAEGAKRFEKENLIGASTGTHADDGKKNEGSLGTSHAGRGVSVPEQSEEAATTLPLGEEKDHDAQTDLKNHDVQYGAREEDVTDAKDHDAASDDDRHHITTDGNDHDVLTNKKGVDARNDVKDHNVEQ